MERPVCPPLQLAHALCPAWPSSRDSPAGLACSSDAQLGLWTHSQVVLPCMLTTHLASWLVSRALKGRTLTATFTEAPAIASETPALLSCRTEKGWSEPLQEFKTMPPCFLSPCLHTSSQLATHALMVLALQAFLPNVTPENIPASLPNQIPVCRDLGHHPRVTWCPGPRSRMLYQFWLPATLVWEAPSYSWGLATPAQL